MAGVPAVAPAAWPKVHDEDESSTLPADGADVLKDLWVSSSLRVLTATWNMGGKQGPDELTTLLPRDAYHIYAVGSEECERSIAQSMVFTSKARWEAALQAHLGDNYQLVASETLGAIHIAVYAHTALHKLIGDVQQGSVPCGFRNTFGNKGGVGVGFNVGKTAFLFINAHLAAHQKAVEERNRHYRRIEAAMPLVPAGFGLEAKLAIAERSSRMLGGGGMALVSHAVSVARLTASPKRGPVGAAVSHVDPAFGAFALPDGAAAGSASSSASSNTGNTGIANAIGGWMTTTRSRSTSTTAVMPSAASMIASASAASAAAAGSGAQPLNPFGINSMRGISGAGSVSGAGGAGGVGGGSSMGSTFSFAIAGIAVPSGPLAGGPADASSPTATAPPPLPFPAPGASREASSSSSCGAGSSSLPTVDSAAVGAAGTSITSDATAGPASGAGAMPSGPLRIGASTPQIRSRRASATADGTGGAPDRSRFTSVAATDAYDSDEEEDDLGGMPASAGCHSHSGSMSEGTGPAAGSGAGGVVSTAGIAALAGPAGRRLVDLGRSSADFGSLRTASMQGGASFVSSPSMAPSGSVLLPSPVGGFGTGTTIGFPALAPSGSSASVHNYSSASLAPASPPPVLPMSPPQLPGALPMSPLRNASSSMPAVSDSPAMRPSVPAASSVPAVSPLAPAAAIAAPASAGAAASQLSPPPDVRLPTNVSDRYDRVFFMGDLNYRIAATRAEVDAWLAADAFQELRARDQLTTEMQRASTDVFRGFLEGPLHFKPTYKFDKPDKAAAAAASASTADKVVGVTAAAGASGVDRYDTSEKARVPAWTDRILWKTEGAGSEVRLLRYASVPECRISDHRPVVATFEVKLRGAEARHRSASLSTVHATSGRSVAKPLDVTAAAPAGARTALPSASSTGAADATSPLSAGGISSSIRNLFGSGGGSGAAVAPSPALGPAAAPSRASTAASPAFSSAATTAVEAGPLQLPPAAAADAAVATSSSGGRASTAPDQAHASPSDPPQALQAAVPPPPSRVVVSGTTPVVQSSGCCLVRLCCRRSSKVAPADRSLCF